MGSCALVYSAKARGAWGDGIGRISAFNARRRARFQGLLTQKESQTRPIDRRAIGPPLTCRPNVDITDPQSHLQRASRFQPYSNGKQRVCPVSDAIATNCGNSSWYLPAMLTERPVREARNVDGRTAVTGHSPVSNLPSMANAQPACWHGARLASKIGPHARHVAPRLHLFRRSPEPAYHGYEVQMFSCMKCDTEITRSADRKGNPPTVLIDLEESPRRHYARGE